MEKASPKNNYHYNPRLLPYARSLRKNMTKAEASLWKYMLKGRQFKGYKFLRQRPVLNYIVDFMCPELMLIIEADGITHDDELVAKRDEERDKRLAEVGFTVLRFSNWEILNRMVDVGVILTAWVEDWEKKHPK